LKRFGPGISPTVSTGGSVVLMSSPNGTGNKFHQLYEGSRSDENGFNCRFGTYVNPRNPEEVYNDRFPWWVRPDFDMAWYQAETRDKSPRDIAQEFNCFEGNTKIQTRNGFTKIKDLRVGDLVLTHKGRFRPITGVRKKQSNNCIAMRSFSNRMPVILTSDHRLLHEKSGWQEASCFSVGDKVCTSPKDIELQSETKTLDLANFPTLSKEFKLKFNDDFVYINDRKHKTRVKRYIKIGYEFGKLIGLFLAEGHKTKNTVAFSFNYKTELIELVPNVCDIVLQNFGLNKPKIYHTKNYGLLQFNSQVLSSFLNLFVKGNNCYNKSLTQLAHEFATTEFYKGVVDGVFIGDGCLKDIYDKTLMTTSEALAYDIKHILTILGAHNFSFRKQHKIKTGMILGRQVTVSDCFVIKLLRTRNMVVKNVSEINTVNTPRNVSHKNSYGECNGFFNAKITSIEKLDETYDVYDIEVADDHSFITEHFVAHNCSFNASGDTFIFSEDINRIERECLEPIEQYAHERNVWIWEKPQRVGVYLIAADVSSGDAADYSAFHVLRLDTYPIEQVCEYKGKIRPDQLGILLMSVSKLYNNAIIAPENNSGWSGQTILKIEEAQYPYLFFSRRRKSKEKDTAPVDPYYAMNRNDFLPGYSVTSGNRTLMLAKLEQYLRLRRC
jgi:hypothetical protein